MNRTHICFKEINVTPKIFQHRLENSHVKIKIYSMNISLTKRPSVVGLSKVHMLHKITTYIAQPCFESIEMNIFRVVLSRNTSQLINSA